MPGARERLPGPPNSPDALLKPQSSCQHRPTGRSTGMELWARCTLPTNAIPQGWRHERGRPRSSTPSMPPAPMGGTWHLEAVEAPEVPAHKNNLMLGIRLQERSWHTARAERSLMGIWRLKSKSGHQGSSIGCRCCRCCRCCWCCCCCPWCRLASLQLPPAVGISSPGKRPCLLGRHRRQHNKLCQAQLLHRLLLRKGARRCCRNCCGTGLRSCRVHRNFIGFCRSAGRPAADPAPRGGRPLQPASGCRPR